MLESCLIVPFCAFYAPLKSVYLCTIVIKKKQKMTKETKSTGLSEQIDYLVSEVAQIKAILLHQKLPKEIPKFLNQKEVLRYFKEQGYCISSSKLYKLTRQDKIPCHRSGTRLYFIPSELDEWLNNQIGANEKTGRVHSIQNIIKSAQNKK